MRIGFDITVLNEEKQTGIGVYTYSLIDSILKANRGDEFVLFGFATFSTYERLRNLDFKRKYSNVEIKVIKLPSKLFKKTFVNWQRLNFPPIEYFIGDVDIFHSFNFYFPPQQRGKKVATVFDLTPFLFPDLHQKNTVILDKIRLERVAKGADLIFTISENSKKDFIKEFGDKKIEVIYPGLNNLKAEVSEKKILDKYNLKPGYILSVATLEPRKNIKLLIKSYLDSGLKNQLVLVGGEGWKSKELIEMAKKNSNIILTGYVFNEELSVIYKNALCFVYPSLYEGFGMPVLEAFGYKVPVITSNVSSLPEVAGNAAILIDPKDDKDLTKQLINVYQYKKLRQDLIKKASFQLKKFSWEKSAEKTINAYRSLF